MGYYKLTPSGGQFHFNLHAANGEKILTSERYTSEQGARKGIASCQVNSPLDARYERRKATNGSPYFVLKGANGEIIGTSETYSTEAARDKGIAACNANGPSTDIR